MGLGAELEHYIKARRIRKLRALPGPLGDFHRAGGNAILLQGAPVTADDAVLDVGAFEGAFTAEVCWRFGARCVAVEPVPGFCAALRDRFARNSRVRVVEAAAGGADGEVELSLHGDGTSAHTGLPGPRVRVRQVDIARLVRDEPRLALLKLNVEGAEYDALDRLVSEGLVPAIGSVLIQFHEVVADSAGRRERIRRALAASHWEVFSYPFVWERWDRRS